MGSKQVIRIILLIFFFTILIVPLTTFLAINLDPRVAQLFLVELQNMLLIDSRLTRTLV